MQQQQLRGRMYRRKGCCTSAKTSTRMGHGYVAKGARIDRLVLCLSPLCRHPRVSLSHRSYVPTQYGHTVAMLLQTTNQPLPPSPLLYSRFSSLCFSCSFLSFSLSRSIYLPLFVSVAVCTLSSFSVSLSLSILRHFTSVPCYFYRVLFFFLVHFFSPISLPPPPLFFPLFPSFLFYLALFFDALSFHRSPPAPPSFPPLISSALWLSFSS